MRALPRRRGGHLRLHADGLAALRAREVLLALREERLAALLDVLGEGRGLGRGGEVRVQRPELREDDAARPLRRGLLRLAVGLAPLAALDLGEDGLGLLREVAGALR